MNMYAGRVPDWDTDGMIPPMDPRDPTSLNRSPYKTTLVDDAARFGGSEARRRLLSGLLDFRAALHGAGLVRGFQWIDGSFVENSEQISGRPPKDIDVVTFFYVPDGYTGAALYQRGSRLFDSAFVKDHYAMDAYFVQLNHARTEEVIEQAIYWYSIWSHTRTGQCGMPYLVRANYASGPIRARDSGKATYKWI